MSILTTAAVWKGSQHSGSALLMMLAIADFADDKGLAYPSVATLAAKTRMKERNAHYLLGELQASGEIAIKVAAGPRGTNVYRIAVDRLRGVHAGAGVQGSAGVQDVAGMHPNARRGALQCADTLHPSAPEPSLNRQEPSEKRSAGPIRLPACPVDEIKNLYREVLPELVQVKVMDQKREKAIRSLWNFAMTSKRDNGQRRATTAAEALTWIRSYFERARENDFIMGRTARSPGHESWKAGIEYVCGSSGQKQVLEQTEEAVP